MEGISILGSCALENQEGGKAPSRRKARGTRSWFIDICTPHIPGVEIISGGGEGSSGTETSICPLTIEGLVQLQRWGLPSQTGSGSTVCPLERAALRFAFLLRAALGPTLDHWFLELGSSCPRGEDAVLLPCTMDLWQKLLCIRQAISKPGLFLHQDARGRGAPGSWRTR